MANPYSQQFYSGRLAGARSSAEAIVPWVVDLLRPTSVLDVGCGTGTWVSTFHKAGVTDVLGVDGDWVDAKMLEVPAENFRRADLTKEFDAGRRYDLVMSLEVAEHLDAAVADRFIESLIRHGDVVLFSAAVPDQGGFHHVNEQWATYWIDKFASRGFEAMDCVRGRFWNVPEVCWWYSQNAFFFVKKGALDKYPRLFEARDKYTMSGIPAIHPGFYEERVTKLRRPGFIETIRQLPSAFQRSMAYRLGKK